jgi:hypothetical protein
MKLPTQNVSANNVNINFNETSSKSLLANVYDDRINGFILNDNVGIINNNNEKPFSNQRSQNVIWKNKSFESYKLSPKDLSILNKNKSTTTPAVTITGGTQIEFNTLKKELTVLLKEIREITKKIRDDDDDEEKSLEWKFAGMVLDKLCLYVFSILTIISTCVILLTSPNFFNLR